jgi:multiple sugar transport system permease protein
MSVNPISVRSIASTSVMVVCAAFFVMPLLILMLAATRTNADLTRHPIGFGRLANLAEDWRTITAYSDGVFLLWLRNSIIISFGGTLLAVCAALPAGYALACLRFGLRRPLLWITMILMVMPNTVLVVPLFLEISAVHMTNTLSAILMIYGFYPFGVFLSYIFYTESLPRELLDASRLDGCSEIGVFRRVALPIARPVIGLIVFFSTVAHWNNFFLSYVMLSSTDKLTLPVGLAQLIMASPVFNPGVAIGLKLSLYMPQLAFAGLITILPMLILFLFAQRYLARGVVMGGLSG